MLTRSQTVTDLLRAQILQERQRLLPGSDGVIELSRDDMCLVHPVIS